MDEGKGWKTSKRLSDTFYEAAGGFVISGGNFHGEYPAKVTRKKRVQAVGEGRCWLPSYRLFCNPLLKGGGLPGDRRCGAWQHQRAAPRTPREPRHLRPARLPRPGRGSTLASKALTVNRRQPATHF